MTEDDETPGEYSEPWLPMTRFSWFWETDRMKVAYNEALSSDTDQDSRQPLHMPVVVAIDYVKCARNDSEFWQCMIETAEWLRLYRDTKDFKSLGHFFGDYEFRYIYQRGLNHQEWHFISTRNALLGMAGGRLPDDPDSPEVRKDLLIHPAVIEEE